MHLSKIYHHKLSSLTIVLFIAAMLILSGCVGVTDNSSQAAAAAGNFKVAMLLPSPIDDQGWSQAAYEGLKLIEKELGAETAYTASVPEDEIEQIFRQYAEEGYNFIIGHGGEYIPAAEVVSEEFPRTKFAVVAGYAGNNRNFGALSFRDGELGYLTGVVAALKSKTGKVGYIGGVDFSHMMEQAVLFERGAKATDLSIQTSVRWIESWSDQDRAREIAQELIESGHDILVVDADTAGLAIHELAQEKEGVYTIGWALDQHDLAPEVILTSAIQRVPILLLEGATLVQLGRWEGRQYKFGMQEGAQDLAPFYGLLTNEEQRRVEAIMEDIVTGKIDVTLN